MIKYVIAKSGCESLLTTKEAWDKNPDELLDVIKEFEAESIEEAEKVYNKEINTLRRS